MTCRFRVSNWQNNHFSRLFIYRTSISSNISWWSRRTRNIMIHIPLLCLVREDVRVVKSSVTDLRHNEMNIVLLYDRKQKNQNWIQCHSALLVYVLWYRWVFLFVLMKIFSNDFCDKERCFKAHERFTESVSVTDFIKCSSNAVHIVKRRTQKLYSSSSEAQFRKYIPKCAVTNVALKFWSVVLFGVSIYITIIQCNTLDKDMFINWNRNT